jgi:hypothetical protein
LYSVDFEALAAEEEAQRMVEAREEAARREALTEWAAGGPIWLDVGDAALDRDCHIEALDLEVDSEVEVLFSCALEALASVARVARLYRVNSIKA